VSRRIRGVRAAESAGGDGGTTLFRPARSDEDGGDPANIAASGASNQTQRDCCEQLSINRDQSRAVSPGKSSIRCSAAFAYRSVSGSTVIWFTTCPWAKFSKAQTKCGRSIRFMVAQ
jgi:hypothetical protein